jgi:PAT family beta-lactamase induction signal transducer AmpG
MSSIITSQLFSKENMLHATMKRVFSYNMLTMLFIGYCSGLPLLLTGGTLQAWMTDAEVDLTTIGFVSLLGLPYTIKFLWSPFLDRFVLPILGRRKGWMIFFQGILVLCIFSLSLVNPREHLVQVGLIALLITFFSASQDIVIDAYRREIVKDEDLGFSNSLYVVGYRIGMLVAGAFALFLADRMSWNQTYQMMALFMAPALLITLVAPKEPAIAPPANIQEAIIGPLKDFFTREGAFIVLSFILLYKVGDLMAANMTTPFMLKIGYTKTDIAYVAKSFGLIATIVGGILGGTLMLKMNIRLALVLFGVLQAVSTLGFALLARLPVSFGALSFVIGFENLAAGLGMAAFGAYMLALTNKKFTATQYALLSSLMGIPRVILPAPTGWMAENMGWVGLFIACTLMAIPGLLLLIPIFKLENKSATA